LELSGQASAEGKRPQLILWPETAVPFLLTDRPEALVAIGDMLGDGQMLMAGAVRAQAAAGSHGVPGYHNSVLMIDDGGQIVDAVDKVHLVPFGEYLPFADLLARAGITQFVAGPMNFLPGLERHAI